MRSEQALATRNASKYEECSQGKCRLFLKKEEILEQHFSAMPQGRMKSKMHRVKNIVLWRKVSQSPGTDHALKFCIELDRTGCSYETGLALAQKEQTYAWWAGSRPTQPE